VKPEVTGPRNHIVIIQKWTVPKGAYIRRSGETIVIPLGRTYYMRPYSWKTLHLPWKLDLSNCRCTIGSAVNLQNLVSSVLIEKSGSIRLQVYNCSNEVICLAARTLGVRIFGKVTYETRPMPNEDGDQIRGIGRGVLGKTETEIKRSLLHSFPTVFDMTEHQITPAMKSLRIKESELPQHGQISAGGQQCTFRIDQQVRDRDIEEVLQRYEKLGYITRAKLNDRIFLSPLMPFRKPGKMDIRVVNDFRELNGYFPTQGRTQIDVRRVMEKVPCTWRFFSVIDLKDGFFSVPLDLSVRHLFGFQYGHRRWTYARLPQGFSFSPIFFAERIAQIIEGTSAINFADDLIVGGETPEEHHANLFAVFRRLQRFGLKVNPEKAKLFRREISFLRYSLKDGQWSLSDYLAEKSKQLGETRSRRELERHIGILSFARSHVPNVELFLRPLRRHLAEAKSSRLSTQKWVLISERVREVYRSCLNCHVPLSLANDCFSRFLLFTDWTDFHVGYMLFGVAADSGAKKLLDIGSHVMKETTSSFLGELSGIVTALKKTKRLRGHVQTTVYSDNSGVVDKLKKGVAISDDVRVSRRLEYIFHNEENAQFRFLPGTENTGADALSRLKRRIRARETISSVKRSGRPEAAEIERRLRQAHFGHWSMEVTLQNAKMEFGFWPGMQMDVKQFVSKCKNCSYSGHPQIRDNFNEEIVDRVGQRVHLDYTGPFFDGSHILVIVDAFSRFVQVKRTEHIGAAHAIRELEKWIDRFGPIDELCGDNASYWNSACFRRWVDSYQIRLRLTPSYFHSGNALAERTIQTLQNRMRRMLNGSAEQWPEVIEAAAQTINESWHSAIETCPQALALGKDRNGSLLTHPEAQELWTKAMKTQRKAKERERIRFEWKHPRRSANLKIGDRVLLKNPLYTSGALGKLSPRWRGPFIIRDRRSRSTWVISTPSAQNRMITAHSSQLRAFP